jgi:transcriptional regulator with XRE-family HTH domain
MTGATTLKKNKDYTLKKIADVLDVDPEYLDCTQAEKRKREPDFKKWNKDASFVHMVQAFEKLFPYAETLGIHIEDIIDGSKTDQDEIIDDGKLVTCEFPYPTDFHYEMTIGTETRIMSDAELTKAVGTIDDFIKFTLSKTGRTKEEKTSPKTAPRKKAVVSSSKKENALGEQEQAPQGNPEELQRVMEEKGFTVETLSKKSGVSEKEISCFLEGKNCLLVSSILMISTALDLSQSQIMKVFFGKLGE